MHFVHLSLSPFHGIGVDVLTCGFVTRRQRSDCGRAIVSLFPARRCGTRIDTNGAQRRYIRREYGASADGDRELPAPARRPRPQGRRYPPQGTSTLANAANLWIPHQRSDEHRRKGPSRTRQLAWQSMRGVESAVGDAFPRGEYSFYLA